MIDVHKLALDICRHQEEAADEQRELLFALPHSAKADVIVGAHLLRELSSSQQVPLQTNSLHAMTLAIRNRVTESKLGWCRCWPCSSSLVACADSVADARQQGIPQDDSSSLANRN